MAESNIPIPDPSEKTVRDIEAAIRQVREIIHAEMGGIQAVIAERLNSIEKRLEQGFIEEKASVLVALAGVTEAGRAQVVKFEVLERRVAALELATSQSSGKTLGFQGFGSGVSQAILTLAAIIAMIGFIIAWNNSERITHLSEPSSLNNLTH